MLTRYVIEAKRIKKCKIHIKINKKLKSLKAIEV